MADQNQPDTLKSGAPRMAPDEREDEVEGPAGQPQESCDGSGGAGGPPPPNVSGPPGTADPIEQFRTLLSTLERESQTSYDKAILTLSGGALGVTLSFLKNVVGDEPVHTGFLLASWVCWGLSLASVLYSFYASNLALRKGITQLDKGTLGEQHPGWAYDMATAVLNAASGLFFLAGAFLFVYFGYVNLEVNHG